MAGRGAAGHGRAWHGPTLRPGPTVGPAPKWGHYRVATSLRFVTDRCPFDREVGVDVFGAAYLHAFWEALHRQHRPRYGWWRARWRCACGRDLPCPILTEALTVWELGS